MEQNLDKKVNSGDIGDIGVEMQDYSARQGDDTRRAEDALLQPRMRGTSNISDADVMNVLSNQEILAM